MFAANKMEAKKEQVISRVVVIDDQIHINALAVHCGIGHIGGHFIDTAVNDDIGMGERGEQTGGKQESEDGSHVPMLRLRIPHYQ